MVVCLEGTSRKKKDHIIWLDVGIMDEKLDRVFSTYSFDKVVFVSRYITKDNKNIGEIEQLRYLLSLCNRMGSSKFLYITSEDAILELGNSSTIIYDTCESVCSYYAHHYQMEIKMLYTPNLMSVTNKNDYWCNILSRLENGLSAQISACPEDTAFFLSMPDLARFVKRLFENWNENRHEDADPMLETLYLKSNATTKYSEIMEVLTKYYPDADISFTKTEKRRYINYHRDKAREDYGWFAQVDCCRNFEDFIEEYRARYYVKPSPHERLVKAFGFNGVALKAVELVLGAALVELYIYMAQESVQFRTIDVRLLFVVIMASAYGTGVGLVASGMEIISLAAAYFRQGRNLLVVFYDPGNWIPFILLAVVAAICGYIKKKSDANAEFVNDENETLREENKFIATLYEEAMEYKNQYKQDLIGSRDGFGRIFDVVNRLSATVPEQIFAEAIPAMEEVLNNRSIAIYTINDPDAKFARLVVASEPLRDRLEKSIMLDKFESIMEAVRSDKVWFNSGLDENLPMYATGIRADGNVPVLILIYKVEYVQISTYFSNLIKIMGGLMENFMLKAWEYQKAFAEETYVDGTSITKADYFVTQLEIRKGIADNRLSSYRLIKIQRDDIPLEDLDEMLQSQVRSNDILGLGDDGNIYILVAQADDTEEEIVLRRLSEMGLVCESVEYA